MKILNVALERAEMNANAILDFAESANLPREVEKDIRNMIDAIVADLRGYCTPTEPNLCVAELKENVMSNLNASLEVNRKEVLISMAIDQIVEDFEVKDLQPLHDLLEDIPDSLLRSFISEDKADEFTASRSKEAIEPRMEWRDAGEGKSSVLQEMAAVSPDLYGENDNDK